tara:strand:+ start:196 stop:540 length:345 start_codon:yes stop_codon:yes gene_type:complete
MAVPVNKKFNTVELGIANMVAAANYDYNRFMPNNEEMQKEFADGWSMRYGKKYIKIVNRNSAWGFIVNTEDDKKFKKGDILKCAGFNAPARNRARGNVLSGGYRINWMGPEYLI